MTTSPPLVTVAVPSFNQGEFLEAAIASLLQQNVPVEIFVVDGGSTDRSVEIIRRYEPHLAGWRSHTDAGQAAAINEAIASGHAPYVCWLNSDDMLEPGGIEALLNALGSDRTIDVAYGRAANLDTRSGRRWPVWVEPFSRRRLALRCIISQPATLIRRVAWERVGGLDNQLQMAMDYDLWWRLSQSGSRFGFIDRTVGVNRLHQGTKTRRLRALHYAEATAIVRRHYGRLPLKWLLWRPYAVWARTVLPWLP